MDRYQDAWNKVVDAVAGKDKLLWDFYLESFRHAAHKGLLESTNKEACLAVLDCTKQIEKTGTVPAKI